MLFNSVLVSGLNYKAKFSFCQTKKRKKIGFPGRSSGRWGQQAEVVYFKFHGGQKYKIYQLLKDKSEKNFHLHFTFYL
jgi:hypothetical protein